MNNQLMLAPEPTQSEDPPDLPPLIPGARRHRLRCVNGRIIATDGTCCPFHDHLAARNPLAAR